MERSQAGLRDLDFRGRESFLELEMGLGRRHWIRPAGSPPAGIGDWERGSRCATARENLPRITSPYANLRILDKMWSGLVWDHLAVEPAMEPDQGGGMCGGVVEGP